MRKVALLSILSLFVLSVVNCDENTPIEPPEEPEYYDDIGTMWQLTTMSGSEVAPTWSPDGSMIAFESYNSPDVTLGIHIVPVEGGKPIFVSTGTDPCWSPDGSLILFDSGDNIADYSSQIYTVEIDTGLITRLTDEEVSFAFDPYWFPDMSRIIFVGDDLDGWSNRRETALYVMDYPDGEPTCIKNAYMGERYNQPAVSPDGTKIAYSYTFVDYNHDDEASSYLYYSDEDGRNSERVEETDYASPSWSPSGKKIAYRLKLPRTLNKGIATYDIQTGDKKRVAKTNSNEMIRPAWSPDGTKIAFAANEEYGGDYNLWIVELNDR